MDVGIVASMASDLILAATMVVFVLQSRHMAQSTRASVYQTVAEQMMAVDRLFIDRPELRKFIYDGAPLPDDPLERSRVLATAEYFIDFADNVLSQSEHIPEYMRGPWRLYFRDVASSSPAVQHFWDERQDWYDAPMRQLLDGCWDRPEPVKEVGAVPLPGVLGTHGAAREGFDVDLPGGMDAQPAT